MASPTLSSVAAAIAGFALSVALFAPSANGQVCAQESTPNGKSCKDPGGKCFAGSLAGKCTNVATLGCVCRISEPGYYSMTATPLSPASVSPGGTATSTITLTPGGGYKGTIVVSCTPDSPNVQIGCGGSQNVFLAMPTSLTITVTVPFQTAIGSSSLTVNAVGLDGVKPVGGSIPLTLNVVKGQPVTYTEVITGAAGSLGSTMFGTGTPIPNPRLTFTFSGNTSTVVPFSIPPAPILAGTDFGTITGFQNSAGTASLQIDDIDSGKTVAKVTFSPSDRIFVFVDNNAGVIGFGAGGLPPTSPPFPTFVSLTFPYISSGWPTTDLSTNKTASPLTGFSSVVDGFLGTGGTSGFSVLPTSGGVLSLNADVFSSISTFSISTTPNPNSYAIVLGPWNSNQVPRGGTVTATTTVNGTPGYRGTVTLSCTVAAPHWDGAPLPKCSIAPSVIPGGAGAAVLTMIVSNQPPAPHLAFPASYSVFVDAKDDADIPPSNGVQKTAEIPVAENSGGGLLALAIFFLLMFGGALWMMRTKPASS